MKRKILYLLIFCLSVNSLTVSAKLMSTRSQNKWTYGKEINVQQFSDDNEDFSGRITYKTPRSDWFTEVTYVKGKSFSEVARPNLESNTKYVSQEFANGIADSLFPKEDRGLYKKQIKNARFISHFFDFGVVSFEMKLDPINKSHIGIEGVRVLKYQNALPYSSATRVNAYH